MADLLQRIETAKIADGVSPELAALLTEAGDAIKALTEANASLTAENTSLQDKARAAGAASTAGPTLAEIRTAMRQELGTEPKPDDAAKGEQQ